VPCYRVGLRLPIEDSFTKMKLLLTADLHYRRDWYEWLLGEDHHRRYSKFTDQSLELACREGAAT